jgi:hypothetical protein
MKPVIITVLGFVLFVISCLAQEGDPLFVVTVNNKQGFIDRNGKLVIDPQFGGAGDFSEGLASVAVKDEGYKEGYIDRTGKIVIAPKWDTAGKFLDGVAWVGFDQAKKEYKIGNKIYSSTPTDSFDFKFGLIDKTGKYIVEPTFTYAGDFSEGAAVVRTKENKFGFVDKSGKFIVEPKFDWAGSFSEGLACVYLNRRYGYINKNGEVVIKPKFKDAGKFSEGLAFVKIGGRVREHSFGMQMITTTGEDRNFAYIDKTGRTVFKIKADGAFSFSEGLARIEIEGDYGFIDKTGTMVIDPSKGGYSDFSEGLCFAIFAKGEIGFIDKTGKIVLKPQFALANDFKNGLASVSDSLDVMKVKHGYIDKTGKVIWQPTK